MRLKDKVAIITGAGSGLGRASALLFAGEGARVVVADIVDSNGEETVRAIKEAGGEAVFVHVDVTKAVDCQKMVKAAIARYGKLDIMFNNAGIPGIGGPVADITEEHWDQVISVNLKGVFLGTKYAIPEMLKGGGGVIINTSSVAGIAPSRHTSSYCAAKAGVIQLTRVIALDYARRNIRANCLLPGMMETPLLGKIGGGAPETVAKFRKAMLARTPMGRFAQPEEVAQAALFLASDEAAFVTGVALSADGGMAVS